MELDELSNNSTISNISNCQSSIFFDICKCLKGINDINFRELLT